jgi:integrase
MPSLIKKKGVLRYRASIPIPGIKDQRRQKMFPDNSKESYKAALRWEEETRKKLEKEKVVTGYIESGTWAENYLDSAEGRFVEKTYKEKQSAFKRLFEFDAIAPEMNIADLVVSKISDKSLAHKFLEAQFKIRSGNAANKDRKNLSSAWEWGKKHLYDFPRDLPNPFYVVERFPERSQGRYVPPEKDFWEVYDIAEGQDKVMLLTAFHLGARRGEMFRLKLADLDFEHNTVRLWTCKRRNGNYEFDFLPMTQVLSTALKEWCDFRFAKPYIDEEHVFVCLDEGGFCLQYYGQPYKVRGHVMTRLCNKAKVKPFGFHAIRHLSATVLYHNGKSLHYLQRFLRHKNPTTTQRYLQKLGLEPLREGLEEGFKRPVTQQPPPEPNEPIGEKGGCEVIQFPKKYPLEGVKFKRVSTGVQSGVQAKHPEVKNDK